MLVSFVWSVRSVSSGKQSDVYVLARNCNMSLWHHTLCSERTVPMRNTKKLQKSNNQFMNTLRIFNLFDIFTEIKHLELSDRFWFGVNLKDYRKLHKQAHSVSFVSFVRLFSCFKGNLLNGTSVFKAFYFYMMMCETRSRWRRRMFENVRIEITSGTSSLESRRRGQSGLTCRLASKLTVFIVQ